MIQVEQASFRGLVSHYVSHNKKRKKITLFEDWKRGKGTLQCIKDKVIDLFIQVFYVYILIEID